MSSMSVYAVEPVSLVVRPQLAGRVTLTDASETVTLAAGRFRSLPVLTQACAKTLSNTGAVSGDEWLIERTDVTAHYLLRINNAAGAHLFTFGKPGRAFFRFNGAAWELKSANVSSGVTEIDLVADFGAIGDGVADDTVPLQNFFDALSSGGPYESSVARIGRIPGRRFRFTTPLKLYGGGVNFHSVKLVGEKGITYGENGTALYYDGANTSEAAVETVGLVSSEFTDISFNANGKAEVAFWSNIRTLWGTPETVTVDTGANTLTHATDWATGTNVKVTTSGTFPAPLVDGGVLGHHVIRVSAGVHRLATTYADAINGVAIDLTTAGTGTISIAVRTGDESSSYCIFTRCAFLRPRNVAGADCFRAGPLAALPGTGATQVDLHYFDYCQFVGLDSPNALDRLNSGFRAAVGSNNKSFFFNTCQFTLTRVGVHRSAASGTCHLLRVSFESCNVDWIEGGTGSLDGANSERSMYAIQASGAATVTARGWEWSGKTQDLDLTAELGLSLNGELGHIVSGGRSVVLENCHFNTQKYRQVSSIDGGTGWITLGIGQENTTYFGTANPVVGERIWVYSTAGDAGLFRNTATSGRYIRHDQPLFITEAEDLGSDSWRIKVAYYSGGPSITSWTYTGAGSIYMLTQSGIRAGRSLVATHCKFLGAGGRIPVDGAGGPINQLSYYGGTVIPHRIEAHSNFGGSYEQTNALPDMTTVLPGNPALGAAGPTYGGPMPIVTSGVSGTRTKSQVRIPYSRLVNEFGGGSSVSQILTIPPRTMLLGARLEAVTAFAGAGLATMTAEVTNSVAGDIMPAASLMAISFFGNTEAELGTLLKTANLVQNRAFFAEAHTATKSITVTVTATGIAFSGLTAGEALLTLEFDSDPLPSVAFGEGSDTLSAWPWMSH